MIQRTYTSTITWVDVEKGIINEVTRIEWKLFGKILLRRRSISSTNKMPVNYTTSGGKMGFTTESE